MKDITCTVIKENKVYQSELKGIRPLMNWLTQQPEVLKDSYVIDKVVGKASALLLIYGGVSRIHGKTMSKTAEEILKHYQVEHSYDELVDYIINNDGTDMCPMEKKVINIDSPEEAFQTFLQVFQK